MSNAANPDADHPYDLPNVPFVQYYKDGGFAIHATYWHDQFGTDESQGCINMTVTDAAYLFGQTLPLVPDGTTSLLAANAATAESTPVQIFGR
jgi:lipoprotein-anchoring transpeptidase ErfK/SrfK